MTSTWTDLTTTPGVNPPTGTQISSTLLGQLIANEDFLRNPPVLDVALSTGASNITTTSTTFVTITGFSGTITTQGNPIEICFDARVNATAARFDIVIDGVSITADNDGLGANTPTSTFGLVSIRRRVALAAGAHTVAIQWRVTTGTGTLYAAGLAQLHVVERG